MTKQYYLICTITSYFFSSVKKNSVLLGLDFMLRKECVCLFFIGKGRGVMKNILIYELDIIFMSEVLILLIFDSCVL